VIVRLLSLAGLGCFAAAVVLVAIGDSGNTATIAVLLLTSLGISVVLGIRAAFHKARDVVNDARTFVTGDIQHARLVSVGEPKGWFNPESAVTLELEGADGAVHSFQRDMPVPFPVAWSHRFAKRFNVPGANADLSKLMAFELKREGMDVQVGRPFSGAEGRVDAGS
jgi:hypothetical protein